MAVAIVPAAVIQQVNHVVTRFGRALFVTGQAIGSGGDDAPGGGGDDVDETFGPTAIESVVVINLFVTGRFAAVAPIRQ
jgi:hypothetical protein